MLGITLAIPIVGAFSRRFVMKNMAVVIMTLLISSTCFAFGGLGGLGSISLSGANEISSNSQNDGPKADQAKTKKKKKRNVRHPLFEGKKISFYKKNN
jgi:hypothetical protein